MLRLVGAGLLLAIGLATASCSGGMVADHIPVWAGGEPEGVPPRPGTPGYETYRQKLHQPVNDPAKAQAAGQTPAEAAPKN